MTLTKRFLTFCLISGLIAGNAFAAQERKVEKDEPTAFDLIKEGNKHVGEDAKDRVVQIRSEKSIGTLTPSIWFVVYYDPDASAKATEVKFGSGKKLTVKRPARILEFASGNREMDKDKLKVNSDKALQIAFDEPGVKRVELRNTQMTLETTKDYGVVWRVRFWASKLRKPNETADIGELWISSETGKVVRDDLKVQRVD